MTHKHILSVRKTIFFALVCIAAGLAPTKARAQLEPQPGERELEQVQTQPGRWKPTKAMLYIWP